MEEAEFVSDEAPSTSGELEQSLGPYHEMIDRECITGYMHGIDSFSFNDSFYKDENRVRRFRNLALRNYTRKHETGQIQRLKSKLVTTCGLVN